MKVQEALKSAIETINEARNQIKELCDVHNTPYPITSLVRYNQAIKGCKSALSDIENSEIVAEALHERNRLGYAVVDVIGTLDEIIENAQEVEVDDFLHIAIPIDKWHELQDALEEMPKRAELYTSPISKEREPINEVYEFEKWLKENTLIRASLNIDLDYADPLAEIAYRAWKARAKLNAEKG